jgi:hypothetical protein
MMPHACRLDPAQDLVWETEGGVVDVNDRLANLPGADEGEALPRARYGRSPGAMVAAISAGALVTCAPRPANQVGADTYVAVCVLLGLALVVWWRTRR